jgi:hypothetical protein
MTCRIENTEVGKLEFRNLQRMRCEIPETDPWKQMLVSRQVGFQEITTEVLLAANVWDSTAPGQHEARFVLRSFVASL